MLEAFIEQVEGVQPGEANDEFPACKTLATPMPVAALREKYRYDNGKLFDRKTGRRAGSLSKKGYVNVWFEGKIYRVHRVVMALHLGGDISDRFVDHINGDRADNRIENLRLVDYKTNNRNVSILKNNKSGHSGVCWNKAKKKWRVQIKVGGKAHFIGLFVKKEDAIAEAKKFRAAHGFSLDHGERIRPTNTRFISESEIRNEECRMVMKVISRRGNYSDTHSVKMALAKLGVSLTTGQVRSRILRLIQEGYAMGARDPNSQRFAWSITPAGFEEIAQ
jgi:hypothetical protein